MSNLHFAFDLDGTITKTELLPLISKDLGIEKEMDELTKKTMDGDIPFDQSFTKRVKMLKNIPISRVQKIVGGVQISKPIFDFLQNNSDRCHIVTGNLDVWLKILVEKLGVDVLSSVANFKDDTLLGVKQILRKKRIHSHCKFPIVAIGDGHNDLEMLMGAQISIAYGGVHAPASSLLEIADYAIYNDLKLCHFLKQLL